MRRQHYRQVRQRPAGTNNAKIPTGEIEVVAKELEVLNFAEVLPFPVDDPEVASKVNEELRLKYRYLDLRRPEMARNLRLRSKVATATRVFMEEQGFLEVETPVLFKSTPEGAREFLIPARTNPGLFYALRNRRSNSSRSSWWQVWNVIINSPAVSVMKTSVPIGNLNLPSSTSR